MQETANSKPSLEETIASLYEKHQGIFFGEEHFSHATSHQMQKLAHDFKKNNVRTVFFEFAESQHQDYLDGFAQGRVSREELLEVLVEERRKSSEDYQKKANLSDAEYAKGLSMFRADMAHYVAAVEAFVELGIQVVAIEKKVPEKIEDILNPAKRLADSNPGMVETCREHIKKLPEDARYAVWGGSSHSANGARSAQMSEEIIAGSIDAQLKIPAIHLGVPVRSVSLDKNILFDSKKMHNNLPTYSYILPDLKLRPVGTEQFQKIAADFCTFATVVSMMPTMPEKIDVNSLALIRRLYPNISSEQEVGFSEWQAPLAEWLSSNLPSTMTFSEQPFVLQRALNLFVNDKRENVSHFLSTLDKDFFKEEFAQNLRARKQMEATRPDYLKAAMDQTQRNHKRTLE